MHNLRSKNPICLYILFFIFLTGCSKQKPANKLKAFTISNEISNQQINCFAQDEKGYIWIGTGRGLNKYNGYEYHQYFNNTENANSICNNNIQSILNDQQRRLWIATDEGICLRNNQKEQFKDISIKRNFKNVSQILESETGSIFANMNKAVYKYDENSNIFYPFIYFDENNHQNKFFIDKNDNLWLISKKNIKCYNGTDYKLIKTFKPNRIPNLFYANLLNNGELWTMHGKGSIRIFNTLLQKEKTVPNAISNHPLLSKALIISIFDYNKNQLLINTHKNGLFLFDRKKGKIIFQNDPEFPFAIPNCQLTSIFKDNHNNLWIGSHEKGLHVIYKYKNLFNNNRSLKSLTDEKSITSIALDHSNKIWFSTYNDELFVYDLTSDKLINRIDLTKFFKEDPFFQDKIKDLAITKNYVWLLTDAKVVCCTYKNDHLIRKKTYNLNKETSQFTQNNNGDVWVCSYSKDVYLKKQNSEEFTSLPLFDPDIIYKSSILSLSNGKIIVAASEQPLKIIDSRNINSIENISLKHKLELNKFEPTTLYEDSQQNIWIGQLDGPLLKFNLKENSLKKINIQNATSIIEDEDQNIWVGTLYGLSEYNLQKNKICTYFAYDGIGGNQFNIGCSVKLKDNSLVFGGTHGLTIFNSSSISIKRKIPLYIEGLKINNDVYKTIQNKTGAATPYSAIKLNHNENVISIYYTALDFSEYSRLRYYYKLEGYNKDWVDAKNNRIAHYANLKPGNYSFKVKITSNDDGSTESESSLQLSISRPPWFSWFAISIYAVIISYIIWLILTLSFRLKMNKAKTLMAIREKEHEAYINNMNMSFFSNVSHEFRTPLTIITAPISSLFNSENINTKEKKLLELVQRSIKRMLRLINQLMDLSKLETDALKLKVARIDVIHQINSILELYIIYAQEKEISLQTEGLNDSQFMMLDLDKLEKIIGNILSNALKFTPQNGWIKFTFEIISNEQASILFPNSSTNYNGSYAQIRIEDNGAGISKDKLENIFLRYYQIDNNQNASYNWGTGIGLYYTKRLINLHHGAIKAESGKDGGAAFSFIIPVSNEAYSYDEIETITDTYLNPVNTMHFQKNENEIHKTTNETLNNEEDRDTILVVDDDIEISYYLRTLLSDHYHVINKYDGKNAYNSLEEINPDLIISDVLMPVMNGYELCEKIKENISFCHIPIILLTAKTLLEEKVEGLETGANAYVTKPFEPTYMQALIKSQLKNKKILSNILSSNTNTTSVKQSILSPKDKVFMDNLYELMEKELDNPEMNISVIAERMKMSRTKFYHKIKVLTNEKPNTFLKKYRLNRAAELIEKREYNISEIAYMTGFVNPAHFSVSFKKQFNCNPSGYEGKQHSIIR